MTEFTKAQNDIASLEQYISKNSESAYAERAKEVIGRLRDINQLKSAREDAESKGHTFYSWNELKGINFFHDIESVQLPVSDPRERIYGEFRAASGRPMSQGTFDKTLGRGNPRDPGDIRGVLVRVLTRSSNLSDPNDPIIFFSNNVFEVENIIFVERNVSVFGTPISTGQIVIEKNANDKHSMSTDKSVLRASVGSDTYYFLPVDGEIRIRLRGEPMRFWGLNFSNGRPDARITIRKMGFEIADADVSR